MRYLVTFLWAFMLTQMLNFILSSLAGGGPLNFWIGVVLAVAITLSVFILDGLTKMSEDPNASEEH